MIGCRWCCCWCVDVWAVLKRLLLSRLSVGPGDVSVGGCSLQESCPASQPVYNSGDGGGASLRLIDQEMSKP